MNLIWAASLVLVASVRNRVRRQVRRLREPKYAVATALGAFYFWSIFLRRITSLGRSGHAPDWTLPLWELMACLLAYLGLASSWLFGGEEGALRFTEAEVQFFFPAPASRAGLIRYKLARTLVVTAISAMLTTLFIGWRVTEHWGFFALGQWMAMTTLSLHTSAASLARASLADHGIRGLRRQVATFLVILAASAAMGYAFLHSDAIDIPDIVHPLDVSTWCRRLLTQPPTGPLFFPARAMFDVAFASSWRGVARALPAAALVLLVHYVWLVRSDVAFEEASLEMAQRVAARADAFRSGRGQLTVRQIRPPFRLASVGRREVALLWKNAIGIVRAYSLRGAILAAYLGLFTLLMVWTLFETRADLRWIVGSVSALALAGYLALLGPIVLRWDLRQDLAQLDLLRALPMSGRQVVVGELLAPVLILTAGQWGALGLGALFSTRIQMPHLTIGARLALILGVAVILPGVTLSTLVLQNAAALLFPGWVGPTRQVRGIEAMGQRLLTLAANLLALVGVLVPATALGALVVAILWWLLGWWAVPLAALAGLSVIALEAQLAIGWMGRVFEKLEAGEGG